MLQIADYRASIQNAFNESHRLESETDFKEIYARFWKKLFSIAYARLNDKQDAEDVVHDVFVSLWVNRKKIEIISLQHYLATAVKYLVLTKLKKKEHHRKYCKIAPKPTSADTPIENTIHHKQVLATITNEIEELPEKCKLIFKYSRHEGMPVKKIATYLSLSPKTVENQLTKAIKHLKLATKTLL